MVQNFSQGLLQALFSHDRLTIQGNNCSEHRSWFILAGRPSLSWCHAWGKRRPNACNESRRLHAEELPLLTATSTATCSCYVVQEGVWRI